MTETHETIEANVVLEQESQTQLIRRDNLIQEVIGEVFGGMGAPELHNFDGTEQEKWRMIAMATGPGLGGFDDTAGKVINVKYFFVHSVDVDGPTRGEFASALRCVSFTPELVGYQFVSGVLARDLARMVRTFGLQPWEPPIHVKVTKTAGKKGHFYNLIPAN